NNYHTLKTDEFKALDMAKANASIFRALKSGGVYLVVDNAASAGQGFGGAANLKRVEADAVKREVLAAGFTLDGESTLLAHANDNHTTVANDASDKFVLRFVKPKNAPDSDKRPKDMRAALAGYFDNTYRTNAGLISVRPVPPGG